jgi:hypothetical protein
MKRTLALLAGLLLAGQIAAQPAAAAEISAAVNAARPQAKSGPNLRRDPDVVMRAGGLSAGPMADLKVELITGFWQGNQRHSTFKVSNIGNATAKDVSVRTWTDIADFGSDEDQTIGYQSLGDMPAGSVKKVSVVCTPPDPLDTCVRNGAKALSVSSDQNPANDWAEDEP